MRNLFVLLFVGCLFFSCKSETSKGEICQAVVSVYKVYESPELVEMINVVDTENDSLRDYLLIELTKGYKSFATITPNDTAAVKSFISELDFDTPSTCAFVPLNNSTGVEYYLLVVYEQTPLISETVTLSISPTEDREYEALFKFADAYKWERITQENMGRQLALAVNGVIKSAPIVQEPIEGGNCSVIGADIDELIK